MRDFFTGPFWQMIGCSTNVMSSVNDVSVILEFILRLPHKGRDGGRFVWQWALALEIVLVKVLG
jgi:hypothetical protein